MSDANVKKCLAMRMDPAWSINAAADYGYANLKVLERAKFKLNGRNDMDRAKLMYLMHHEGEGAGPKFVDNKLAPTDADKKKLKKKFAQQLAHLPKSDGTAEMQKLVDLADGDVEIAYRFWLAKYVDKQFSQSTKYFIASPIETSKLSDLLVRIGGKEVESVD